MACKQCDLKPVWEFTNQIKLCKNCFCDYFERKVFRTIRKYQMLPEDKIIILKKLDDLNTVVLKKIIEKKFKVEFSSRPNFSAENLSDVSEEIFSNVLQGKFIGPSPEDLIKKPLYFLFDKEIELYAKLKKIKGKKKIRHKKVQDLFNKFLEKNPDLEHNVVNAFGQLKKI